MQMTRELESVQASTLEAQELATEYLTTRKEVGEHPPPQPTCLTATQPCAGLACACGVTLLPSAKVEAEFKYLVAQNERESKSHKKLIDVEQTEIDSLHKISGENIVPCAHPRFGLAYGSVTTQPPEEAAIKALADHKNADQVELDLNAVTQRAQYDRKMELLDLALQTVRQHGPTDAGACGVWGCSNDTCLDCVLKAGPR